jgi:phage terminase large subunit-like protein
MQEAVEAKIVVRRGRQARRAFGEHGDGMQTLLADAAGHALGCGNALIGTISGRLPETETAVADPVREGADGTGAGGPGEPAAGECVAPPMAAAIAPLSTDGAAPSRPPAPAAHGCGDGMRSTAPGRHGSEATPRHREVQAAPMSDAPIGSADETVCAGSVSRNAGQAASPRIDGAAESPADVPSGHAAADSGPLIAAADAASGVGAGNAEPLISEADVDRLPAPVIQWELSIAEATETTDPESRIAEAPETTDPTSAALEQDLAALVAERGLLASRRSGRSWAITGREEQRPPAGDWSTWLVMGGRGSGKTRAGAEWVHGLALAAGARTDLRIALIAETLGDAREVMIDGASGIARIARRLRPEVEISRRRIVWPNGAIAQIFSSEDPESLRGPQFHYAWCDELAKWKHAEETFDMLQFGLRLGEQPRQLVTTTPRAVPLLKRLIGDADTVVTRLSTADNAAHLAPGFITALERRYGGTRLGRQELGGELIEDREDALWKRDRLEALTVRLIEPLRRIVVAVDPPAGSGPASVCGIVVAGLMENGRAAVLADCSVEGRSPADWARAVVNAYRRFEADRVVAEVNQGGDMVAAMLKSVEANLPVALVRATRGKYLRAEPVAALYEQGRVVHAARFVALEDQMCDFGPDGLSGGRSPDRLDALVWALTALMLEGTGEPRIRGM